ncbi:MAG TPA: FAD binding domain-containing protein [Vicinamibacterales bacterium]|nr:FAD binding domain-containing protein [Vicinamibacterales bacterium]
MIRLPRFDYRAPRTVSEAAQLLADANGEAMLLAGGTDLVPNMKRRQQTPRMLIALQNIAELKQHTNGSGHTIGAGLTLSGIVRDEPLRRDCTSLWQAAAQVATPHLRAMGTLGGNLCLDTRCNYYDQSYEWRKAISFCMKKDGDRCWVATSSPTCLAVSSTDTAPALIALGASVSLVSSGGTRQIPVTDLYRNDGMYYLTRQPDEILTAVHLPDLTGWRSTYWKLRRRGSFDFPVLGVAAAARFDRDGAVLEARIVLGAVSSRPLLAEKAAAALIGQPLTDEVIAEAADLAFTLSKPMDNTDFALVWRKRVTRDFVTYALRELRGDDMRATRTKIARHALQGLWR